MRSHDKERADEIDSKALFRIGKKDKEGRPSIYRNGQAIATVAFMQASLDRYYVMSAAAPDMLDTLKDMAAWTNEGASLDDLANWMRALARAAIAKAEGREV